MVEIQVHDVLYVQREWYPVKPTIAIRCLSSKLAARAQHIRYDELFLEKEYVGVLPVVFDDLREYMKGHILFNEDHARKIRDFVEKHMGKFEEVMVHCDAGASRSPAVASALGNHYGWHYDDGILMRCERGRNQLVYDILTRVLRS